MRRGLFDEENRMEKLSRWGDSLVHINNVIQREIFHPVLEKALRKKTEAQAVVRTMTVC